MLKKDLIGMLASKRGLSPRVAEDAVDHIFETMRKALAKGDHIEIRGLGRFQIREHSGYTGRNPKTLATMEIRPKERLNGEKSGKSTEPGRKPDDGADSADAA